MGSPKSTRSSNVDNSQLPPTTYEIEIPGYNFTSVNGYDYVDIPGGSYILEHNQYRVPYYFESIEIPNGYEIQDVTLNSRIGSTVRYGLNLSIVTVLDMDSDEPIGDPPGTNIEPGEEWYPKEDFRWTICENPNGSSTLYIIVYPFYYNLKTKDAEYYTDYEFDINYVQSCVELTEIILDKQEYDLDESVNVEVSIQNFGTSTTNVILSSEIEPYTGLESVLGLELQTFDLRPGISTTTISFNTQDLETGYYNLKLTVLDLIGNSLDSKTQSFIVGICQGNISDFTAIPLLYLPGENISLKLDFKNTGSIDFNGTTVIAIKDVNGDVVEEFSQSFSNLTPLSVTRFEVEWGTPETDGKYLVSGCVYYDSKTANSQVLEIKDINSAIIDIIENIKELYLAFGIKNSLISKLENAIKSVEKYQYNTAIRQLEAFFNEVNAQCGKELSVRQGDMLKDHVCVIIDKLKNG
jgi:hypothetical protein